jgi:hypothetical protein
MHCIIAFICRTLLLAIYIVLSRYEYDAVPLDMLDRIVVTCLQACVLGAAWVVYEVCAFVIRILSRTRSYTPLPVVLSDRPNTEQVHREAKIDASAHDKMWEDDTDADTDTHVDAPPGTTTDTDDADNASRVSHASRASRASHEQPTTTRVVFDSRHALARYVAKVHIIGVVVWTTMLSIDYVLTQTSFLFALGMLLGNVAWVLSGPQGRAGMPLHVLALYWSISLALIVLYLLRDGAAALEDTETELGMTPNRLEWSQTLIALTVLLSPASCGFTWTFWIDARTLLAHYHTSLYTSVILSVPVLIFVRGTYLVDILSRYSTPWLTHVVLIEPVLKFMTIYAMTLSLDAESVVEMLTVNTSVVGACYLFFEPHDTSYSATVAVLVAALLILHLARLTRRALRERRTRQHTTFVVEDD